MATVGLSNHGSDVALFHHNMVVGDAHQASSIRSESTQNLAALAQTSRLPNTPSTQARFPVATSSSTPTPTPSTAHRNATTRSRASSQSQDPAVVRGTSSNREIVPPDGNGSLPSVNQEQEYTSIHNEPSGDGSTKPGIASAHASIPPSPRLEPTQRSVLSFTGSGAASPSRIKVRDLGHIQSFASEEVLTRSRQGSSHSLKGQRTFGQQYEISAMPVTDIIEMVAGLLTKITTTNDQQREHIHRHIPPPDCTAGLSQQETSVLAFHGKNAPSITILSYLSRIHKYCPTTYEVFLSLLIYFDRMTEMVNSGSLTVFGDERPMNGAGARKSTMTAGSSEAPHPMTSSLSSASSVPKDHESAQASGPEAKETSGKTEAEEARELSQFFVVDSYNIHRLVIAGVTSASKFFSDVFYTNSRYAKVRIPLPCILLATLILCRLEACLW